MKIDNNSNQVVVLNDSNLTWYKKFNARIVEGPGINTVCKMEDAYNVAKQNGIDVVIIKNGILKDGNCIPAIVKLIDYGKFLYDKKKREKENAKKQRESIQKVKEVKFHVGIDDGDYNYKLNHIKEFLDSGDKVNCQIVLRGREKFNDTLINSFVDKLTASCIEFADFIKKFDRQGNLISGILVKKVVK